jgi:precorrin-3B C17-methyltransferase
MGKAMTGWLAVVGLGPGDVDLCAPRAVETLAAASDLVGYEPYLARLPTRLGQTRHSFDNRSELERARLALTLARAGGRVAVVSGGDPGVFAMASAVFEAMEAGPADWRNLDVQVIPGISALLAVAAKVGAPLGGDFCAISLSDNCKPWDLVCRRLRLAAAAEFAIALYNPRSGQRAWQLDAAFAVLRETLPFETPVVFARAISRPEESVLITRLAEADGSAADMRSLVLIGSCHTRWIVRPDGSAWLYTPRSVS